jgi:hypothetical protein
MLHSTRCPFACFLLLAFAACASPPKSASFPEAQTLVEQVARKHTEVSRLTLHAVTAGDPKSRVIASTLPERLNTWSDPEDKKAMDSGQPVTLKEGDQLDYTAPVKDASGKSIASVGVTVKGGAGATEATQTAKAKAVADEVAAAVLAAGKPLW